MKAEKKHVVSFSGGLCSFWTAMRVAEKYGTENMVLLFADTMIEDEDLYRFNADVERLLGVPLTVVRDGRTPWEVFRDKRFLGNSRVDPCSAVLKRALLDRWKVANCDPSETVMYMGLDWTVEHRLVRLRKRMPKWQVEAPMCEAPYWTKSRMVDECRMLGIDPPRLYGMGFHHNNCGGFCVKSGHAQFALLLRTMPERYAYHERMEQGMRVMLGDYGLGWGREKNVAILNDRAGGGPRRPLTLKAFRERIEEGDANGLQV